MALADLMQALEQDAAAQARSLLDAARTHAAELEAAAARGRDNEVTRAIAAWCDECRATSDEQLAAAQRRARKTLLTARAAMLDRVRAALLAELPAHLPRVCDALAHAAFRCTGERKGVLRCAPSIVAHVRVIAPATLRVEEAPEVATGLVIELETGTRVVATLAALVDREWPRLAAAIVGLANEEVTS